MIIALLIVIALVFLCIVLGGISEVIKDGEYSGAFYGIGILIFLCGIPAVFLIQVVLMICERI